MKAGILVGLLLLSLEIFAGERANIVLMFVDNVGYGDLGCYGNREMKTPRIDRLAQEGVLCADFYIMSPSCMPSRAALLTGRHPLRNGLNEQLYKKRSVEQIALRHSEKLIPEHLKAAGYASACIGKWNVGFAPGSRPTDRGFDYYLGNISGNCDYYTYQYDGEHDLYEGTKPVRREGYSTYLFANAASEFIRENKDRPFFVYLPFNAAHYPNFKSKNGGPAIWQAPAEAFTAYGYDPQTLNERQRYRAVIKALDQGVGTVLDTIDECGLREKTLVIFLSDNGAFMIPGRGLECASNRPLKGGGTMCWEGGIRVPALVRWPGRIKPGVRSATPMTSLDLLPLILRAADVNGLSGVTLDGKDPLAALQGKVEQLHDTIFWRYGKYRALRHGDWKMVKEGSSRPWMLFNLRTDVGETSDQARAHPDLFARLVKSYDNWLAGMPFKD